MWQSGLRELQCWAYLSSPLRLCEAFPQFTSEREKRRSESSSQFYDLSTCSIGLPLQQPGGNSEIPAGRGSNFWLWTAAISPVNIDGFCPKRTRTPQCREFEWLPIVKVSAIPSSCIDHAMRAESQLRRKHPADRDGLFLLHPAHIPCLALGRTPWEEETLAVPSPALTMV